MHKKLDNETPRFDVQLFFDEIGVLLDDNQYRDAISLVDMYHIYMRNRQVNSLSPRCFNETDLMFFVDSISNSDPLRKSSRRIAHEHC